VRLRAVGQYLEQTDKRVQGRVRFEWRRILRQLLQVDQLQSTATFPQLIAIRLLHMDGEDQVWAIAALSHLVHDPRDIGVYPVGRGHKVISGRPAIATLEVHHQVVRLPVQLDVTHRNVNFHVRLQLVDAGEELVQNAADHIRRIGSMVKWYPATAEDCADASTEDLIKHFADCLRAYFQLQVSGRCQEFAEQIDPHLTGMRALYLRAA